MTYCWGSHCVTFQPPWVVSSSTDDAAGRATFEEYQLTVARLASDPLLLTVVQEILGQSSGIDTIEKARALLASRGVWLPLGATIGLTRRQATDGGPVSTAGGSAIGSKSSSLTICWGALEVTCITFQPPIVLGP